MDRGDEVNRIEVFKMKAMRFYKYDSGNGIYINKSEDDFQYFDSSEEYLLSVFETSKVNWVYPYEAQKYIKDWPTRYHFSHQRTNLIEAFTEFFEGKRILELGAGTGTLTGILSFLASHVDAVEGSTQRAILIKERLKHVDNLRVFVDRIESFIESFSSVDEPYDVCLLVGVLGHIPYCNSKSAVISVLSKIASLLKEDGILFLVIENKFGAKYFTGCSEDHNGRLFSGLIGYLFKSPLTFSINELKNLLEA